MRRDGTAQKASERTMLDEYVAGVRAGWSDEDLYRLIIKNTGRRFHNGNEDERQAILKHAPELSGTPWDALIAAVIEHIASTHGYERPAWVDEIERFATEPVRFLPDGGTDARTACCPGAFLRHGALIDPKSLDSRNGEEAEW